MSPNARERAYEKRRYEEWQAKLADRKAGRRRARFLSRSIAAVVLVVLVIGGTFFVVTRNNDSKDTASPAPSAATNKACPVPTVKPPATPVTIKTAPPKSLAAGKTWTMTMVTSCGTIEFTMDGVAAPQATAGMIALSTAKFFDGSPCHRLATDIFVLQCGDPTGTGSGGPGFEYGPIENAPKDAKYPAGTVAMARRANDGKSMSSQFFLVYKDTEIGADSAGGYTVLGKITKGMDVLQKVAEGGIDPAKAPAPAEKISIVSTKVTAGTG